jgi:hypothetical protein
MARIGRPVSRVAEYVRGAYAQNAALATTTMRRLNVRVLGIGQEQRAQRLDTLELCFVVGAALVLTVVASHLRSTYLNNYVRLGNAILHGHLWIDWPGRIIDAVEYHGQHYGVDGPFPVVFVFPSILAMVTKANQTPGAAGVSILAGFFVWMLLRAFNVGQLTRLIAAVCVFAAGDLACSAWQNGLTGEGMRANETTVATIMGAVDVGLLWTLFRRLHVRRVPRLWLCLFVFAGTDLWWCSELGDVWFFAHIIAISLTVLTMLECTGQRRGWLIGLLAACAVESRFTMVMALPFYAYLIATGDLRSADAPAQEGYNVRKELRQYAGVLLLGVAGWMAYNEAMWGTIVDIGHTIYYHQDSWGHPTGSPFQLAYVPYEIYSFFIRGPEFTEWLQVAQYPYFKVNPNGVALTFTSPALVLAFLAPRSRLRTMLWITTVLVAVPSFMYYLNGWYQFGMRHALDFEPFLFVLMALAVRNAIPVWGMILCAYSALVGTWGVWYWSVFFRTGD